jgi:two-component system nitrogen regulation response regulator GlnG
LLEQYDWPGNVRELQSAVKYALVGCSGDVLTAECLPASCRGPAVRPERGSAPSLDVENVRQFVHGFLARGEFDVYRKIHGEIDRILLPEVLNHVAGNQVQASEVLGISRSTLRTRIADLGLMFEKRLRADTDREEPPRR